MQPAATTSNTLHERPNITFVARCFRGYGVRVLVTFLCLAGARLATTVDPLLLKRLIDGIAAHHPMAVLMPAVVIYLGLKALAASAELARDWVFSPVFVGVARRVSETVFDHLLQLPVSYHAEQQTGALARKIARGTRALTWILDFMVMSILPTLIELVFVTVLLLRLYPIAFGLLTLATVVAYTCFTIWATEKRQRFRLNANIAEDDASGAQIDSIANIETVKYFHNEPLRQAIFGRAIQRWFDLSVRSNQLFAAISFGQQSILLVGMGTILLMGISQAASGQLTVGDLVLLTSYVVRLSVPIASLGFVYRGIKDGIADLDAMGRIFDVPITISEPVNPIPLPDRPRGDVEFENVSFAYTGRDPVMAGLQLRIPAGSRVAIVGPSGAGKSTLVRLLFRFHDPVDGRVLLDGIDLRCLSRDDRRRLLAIVPQEPVLFNDTIAENVRFGRPEATQSEIEDACRLANIHDFIAGLPEGYATMVGERGVKLSGGEKQRVAIARAVIRDPRVLVFDEATSSLDTQSERVIQESLDRLASGRTMIVIAHRLSTIVDSDVIYVLEDGRIAEWGTHDALLDRDGLYSRLWSLQAGGQDSPALEEKSIGASALVA